MNGQTHESIEQAADVLQDANRLFVVTGAGMSADSGLPTYRGVGGLYDVDDTEEGLPIEVLLSGEMMAQRPELTWKYLAQVAEACQSATFNRGHEVLVEMESRFERVLVLTQNVDGFHRAAGSTDVIDIHGDLHDLYCGACGYCERFEEYTDVELPPSCPRCGGMVRPDVVLFGEMLSPQKLDRMRDAVADGFDAVLSIGTTSVFPYIAEPMRRAHRLGLPAIEINPGDTEVSHLASIRIRCGAAESLDAIWTRMQSPS